jgi:hypothetical protein
MTLRTYEKKANPREPDQYSAHVALLASGIVSVWVAPNLGE